MNVLLTSAGRRTSLLEAFQSTVHPLGGRVWASDCDALAPALQVADAALCLPPVDDEAYLPALKEHVAAHNIELVIPLIDPGLYPLARLRAQNGGNGCCALVSEPALLAVTMDKWNTVQHFAEQGIRTPASWLPSTAEDAPSPNLFPQAVPDPVFVKPRRGSASQDARQVGRDDLPRVLAVLEDPLVQEVMETPEITVDALFDLEGTLVHYVPRLRIRTMGGESIQGYTLPDDDDGLGTWLRGVLHEAGTLGARGPLTLQAFLTEPEPTLSEINARFGGGFPLAYAAGGRYPDWIVTLAQGKTVTPRLGAYEAGLYMTRAHTEWFMNADALDDDVL